MSDPKLTGYKATASVSPAEPTGEHVTQIDVTFDAEDQATPPSTADPDKTHVSVASANNKLENGNTEKDKKEEDKDDKDKEKKENEDLVGVGELFGFATCVDVLLMIIGGLGAAAHGSALPLMIIVFGDMVDLFVGSGNYAVILSLVPDFLTSINTTIAGAIADPGVLSPYLTQLETNLTGIVNNNNTVKEYMDTVRKMINFDLLTEMEKFAIWYIIIAGGVLICGYLQVTCWATAAERQSHTIRSKFLKQVLRQEIGWFDTHESGELNNRLADDINKIHDGIGDKIGTIIQSLSAFITGIVIGFVYGWLLTLVTLAISPLLAAVAVLMTKILTSYTTKELDAYAKAGAVAEEVLSSIRTVAAFGGQQKECVRYSKNLNDAKEVGIKKGLTNGLSMGVLWVVIFCCYGFGFWYGAKLTRDQPDTYTIGRVLIVFFSVIIAAFSLGNASPGVQALSAARGAGFVVFKIIKRIPDIDSYSEEGQKPDHLDGNIELRNVHFVYPSRQDVKVLKGVNLKIPRGKTVALVGSSGCGKSTVVQLLQRFYDPEQGQILIDGIDMKDLNVKWLRQHIGIVSQEPVLFATSIAENIRYGRDGVSQEEIENAAKMANAHDFILNLPDKYDTLVGERGAQLSGGQKQRVAIARALVRDPKILLLDEATSALDTESEAVVQEALDKARAGRTTIVVAHRLSTIKTADTIAGFQEGLIVESGNHEELMKKGGVYATLVSLQTQKRDTEEDEIIAEYLGGSEKKSKPDLKRMTSVVHADVIDTKSSVKAVHDKEDAEKKDEKKKEEEAPEASFKRVIRLNAQEWPYILIGSFCSLLNGGLQPAFAVIFSEVLGAFGEPDHAKQEQEVNLLVIIMCAIGAVSFFTNLFQAYFFGKSGELMTLRIRELTFKAMLRQDISWFDDPKNGTGALTTRLSTDASQVQGAAGVRIGTFLQTLGNMGVALILAFIWGWKLTLVILAFVPIIAIGGALQMTVLNGVAGKNKEALEDAGKIATEAIENIRTVAGLTKEEKIWQLYVESLLEPYHAALVKSHIIGIAFSISNGVIFFAYAAAFYFGAYMIKENEMNFEDVFKVFSVIVFGAMALGQASSFAPDASKAAVSAGHIFALLDREPSIDIENTEGEMPKEGTFTSSVKFVDTKFRYPTRPDVEVLQGLTLSVDPGQTMALVGASGCGKSTTVQLIERFYDAESGSVKLDSFDIKDLNVQWLRSQIGIVSQEPILFDCSIAENIAYGDNSREVPMAEIIQAARSANIHQFIESLPQGYETSVGEKGAQLSGGQKQRVAIARALVRNPKILLLDEATSALDTESEKVVQEALDRAREGRTCIVIAHRLSTIQNADKICVIKHGTVSEEGKHSDLMNRQGIYYKLNTAQKRQK